MSAYEITVAIEGRAERTTLANDAAGHVRLVRLITRGKGIARDGVTDSVSPSRLEPEPALNLFRRDARG